MWVIVALYFPTHTKKGRCEYRCFCNNLLKDGFEKIHKSLYLRYCSTLNNAQIHKKRVQNAIFKNCKVSVFLIGDKQTEFAYLYLGSKNSKKSEELFQSPETIDFF